MSDKKSVHITLRMPLVRRTEFAVACNLLDVTMSKKLHRVILETIQAAKKECPEFDELVQAQLADTAEKAEGNDPDAAVPFEPYAEPHGVRI